MSEILEKIAEELFSKYLEEGRDFAATLKERGIKIEFGAAYVASQGRVAIRARATIGGIEKTSIIGCA